MPTIENLLRINHVSPNYFYKPITARIIIGSNTDLFNSIIPNIFEFQIS